MPAKIDAPLLITYSKAQCIGNRLLHGRLRDRTIKIAHLSSQLAGVEHLLRNVKDATISTLATDVSAKLQALKGLKSRLGEIQGYLDAVIAGELPINNDIMTHLQVSSKALKKSI